MKIQKKKSNKHNNSIGNSILDRVPDIGLLSNQIGIALNPANNVLLSGTPGAVKQLR